MSLSFAQIKQASTTTLPFAQIEQASTMALPFAQIEQAYSHTPSRRPYRLRECDKRQGHHTRDGRMAQTKTPSSILHAHTKMAEWRKRKDGPGRDGGRTSCETLPHHDPSVLHVLRTLQHTLLISPYPLLRFHDLTNCDTQYPHSRSRIFLWQLK